jgi:hypothetical protein
LTSDHELVRVEFPTAYKKRHEERRAQRGGTPLMPDELVVLREDIARALLGEGLRIPVKPPPQKFVEIDLDKDSLPDIEAKLEAMYKRIEAFELKARDAGTGA